MCHPDRGDWLGFQIGMSKAQAIAAGCQAVVSQQIGPSETYFALRNGRCVPDERVSDMTGKWAVWDMWVLKPLESERHCFGPEGENVAIDFDRSTGVVKQISAYCAVTMP